MTVLGVIVLQLAVVFVPLYLLAKFGRVFPSAMLVAVVAVVAIAPFALISLDGPVIFSWNLGEINIGITLVQGFILALDGLVLVVAVLDLILLAGQRKRSLTFEREMVHVLSIRKPQTVTLTVHNRGGGAAVVAIRDDVPFELGPNPIEFRRTISGRRRATLTYQLSPSRRGAFTIGPVHVRFTSLLRLWRRFVAYPVTTNVSVYPDMKQLSQYELLARTNRLTLLGVRRQRRVGQDHDFERLRDYTPDDSYKAIDWRTTARRRKLTVKQFQASQSQQIIFLLDCGRMMTNQADGLSMLDHGLNAMLMLAYVALRQNDSVGMIAFSDDIHRYVPPRSGRKQVNHLLHACFDQFPTLVESRYDLAFRYLASHCRKRSLVVLVTNLIDEVNAAAVEQHMTNLVGKHLPLGVLLRDHHLFDAVADEHPRGSALWRAGAAAGILSWRHQILTDLQGKGVLALDVFPEQMTAPLINQYLEVKARHLL